MAADLNLAGTLHHIARQVASSTLASSIIPSTTIASNEPVMTQPSPTVTLTPPSPTPTGDHSVTQNPLVFFVALGFGVVFTNLWYGTLLYLTPATQASSRRADPLFRRFGV